MHARFLEIEITGDCPCRCRHCYGSFPKPGSLSLATVERLAGEARGLFDCIILSGGEPLLHPDLTAMVDAAACDHALFITTSGQGLTPELAGRICSRSVLVFGLDGIGQTHDWYRRKAGAYEAVLRAMGLCRDLPTEIIVTLWKGVLPQIDELIGVAEKYNAIIHFNGLIPVGRVPENPEILPSPQELQPVHEKLTELKLQGAPVITDLHRVTARDREEGIPLFCRGRYSISPTGDVRPCEFHTAILGNIYGEPLGAIVERSRPCEPVASRERGFRDRIPDHLPDPFDYHTFICHRLPVAGNAP